MFVILKRSEMVCLIEVLVKDDFRLHLVRILFVVQREPGILVKGNLVCKSEER